MRHHDKFNQKIKIGQMVAEIWRLSLTVFKVVAFRHLGFLKFNFYTGQGG